MNLLEGVESTIFWAYIPKKISDRTEMKWNMEEFVMESEKLPITKGNRLIKKRFNLLMKEHKDFFEEKEPNHFFRVKDHFMQWIYVWIDSMGGYPRFDCIIQPAFLPEFGSNFYAVCECIRFKEMLPREKQKIDFFL